MSDLNDIYIRLIERSFDRLEGHPFEVIISPKYIPALRAHEDFKENPGYNACEEIGKYDLPNPKKPRDKIVGEFRGVRVAMCNFQGLPKAESSWDITKEEARAIAKDIAPFLPCHDTSLHEYKGNWSVDIKAKGGFEFQLLTIRSFKARDQVLDNIELYQLKPESDDN